MSDQANETMIFNTKADARRVSRRLRDHSILSILRGREVEAIKPHQHTGDLRELMRRLLTE